MAGQPVLGSLVWVAPRALAGAELAALIEACRADRLGLEGRMAWVFLGIAGLLEVLWAYMLKVSNNLTKPVEASIAIVAMIASFIVLSMAMKSLPLGTAYAIWTGIGAVGALVLGIIVLGEAATPMRIGSALLIVAGMVGLKLASEA
jgi:quaternary ammonium compound-resistance protein SugE